MVPNGPKWSKIIDRKFKEDGFYNQVVVLNFDYIRRITYRVLWSDFIKRNDLKRQLKNGL